MRQFFVDAWRKQREGQATQPLESLVADVIADHPEYQALLERPDADLTHDFHGGEGESNPFLHMGMHISLREQLGADRPAGIRDLYQRMRSTAADAHECEHRMMDCLEKTLWEAQSAGRAPDEQTYLACLRQLLAG